MSRVLNLRVTLTPDDYRDAGRAFCVRQPRLRGILLVAGLVFAVGLADGAVFGRVPWPLLVLPAAAAAGFLLLWPESMRRYAANNVQCTTLVHWELSNVAVIMRSSYESTCLGWDEYVRVYCTPGYYLFEQARPGLCYQFLPRRAFNSPEEEEAFRALVARHLPGLPETRGE